MNYFILLLVIIVLVVIIIIAKRFAQIKSMSFIEFLKHLAKGDKKRDIDPKQFNPDSIDNAKIIDLRLKEEYDNWHIEGSTHQPFDDFLESILVHGKYPDKNEELILICDHGQMSKVAADILGEEEGYTNVKSLRGGIKSWKSLHSNSASVDNSK